MLVHSEVVEVRGLKKGEPFLEVKSASSGFPVFSEAFLYSRMNKYDARFILAIGREYAKLIEILGTDHIKDILREEVLGE